MRKVIQITGDGVYLCDDGTMWSRVFDGYDEEKGMQSAWLQLDDVPQESNVQQPKFTERGSGRDRFYRPFLEAPPNTEYRRVR